MLNGDQDSTGGCPDQGPCEENGQGVGQTLVGVFRVPEGPSRAVASWVLISMLVV
jgi:hypothetical protein